MGDLVEDRVHLLILTHCLEDDTGEHDLTTDDAGEVVLHELANTRTTTGIVPRDSRVLDVVLGENLVGQSIGVCEVHG